MPSKSESKILTTGQVAQRLSISPQTVAKLIDEGRLKGWRIPGSKVRRVDSRDLRTFCIENDIPVCDDFVVWLLDDQELLYQKTLYAILGCLGSFTVAHVRTDAVAFKIGMEQPDLLVINYDVAGREVITAIAKVIRSRTRIVVMTSKDLPNTLEALLKSKHCPIVRYEA